jgi:prepilin-type N-terminal cleavage/methylation domain-containing protein
MKSSRGFTLVEMLITISIMLIITGGGIAAFIGFNERQNVQVAVKELQTMLRSAQVKAKVGEDAEYCRSTYGESLRGYRVYIADGTGTAILYTTCSDNKFSLPVDRTYVERSRIYFDSTVTAGMQGGGDLDVEFLALLGGVDGSGTIEIAGSGSNVYNFVISSSGEIREGAFQ